MVALSRAAIGALLLVAGAVAQSCNCAPEVTYLVVEMPPQTQTSVSVASPPTTTALTVDIGVKAAAVVSSPTTATAAATTTVCTLAPAVAPNVNASNPANLVPSGNVTLYYTQASSNTSSASIPGSVNMNLSLNNTGVVLENIDAVSSVECFDDLLVVAFDDASSFDSALQAWQVEESTGLVMVTNHLGNCDTEFERGFFVVEGIASNSGNNTVILSSSRQEIANISKALEMTFASLPAAGLTRRLTLDPSFSIPFAVSIPKDTVIYSDSPYVTVTADDASFSSNVTFSGYLNYDFWGFKLTKLYFDLDTSFTADLDISAGVGAAYSNTFSYSPGDLAYYVVDVPGVVQVGPALDFGVGLALSVSGAVNVTAGISVALADGNVHLDVLNSANNQASGWTPTYNPTVNISEAAEVTANASASVTVELAFTLLGGLLDLSSGLTAVPSFNNVFTLASAQDVNLANVTVTGDAADASCPDGVHLKSDFDFTLTGFATKYWSTQLYSVDVPLLDKCWDFS